MKNEEELNKIVISSTNLGKSPINKSEEQGIQYMNQNMSDVITTNTLLEERLFVIENIVNKEGSLLPLGFFFLITVVPVGTGFPR